MASFSSLRTGINADEPRALDYNDYNQPGLYNPDAHRSSDHDPADVAQSHTEKSLKCDFCRIRSAPLLVQFKHQGLQQSLVNCYWPLPVYPLPEQAVQAELLPDASQNAYRGWNKLREIQ